jgi:hypothetical protein
MTSNRRLGAGLVLALALASRAAGDEPVVEVVVSASHHHVLRHWLRAAEQGVLPRSGVTVVHLDGHPDLGVPRNPIAGVWPERAEQLVAALDIATFQLAAVRVGLVDRVVWLRAWTIPAITTSSTRAGRPARSCSSRETSRSV